LPNVSIIELNALLKRKIGLNHDCVEGVGGILFLQLIT